MTDDQNDLKVEIYHNQIHMDINEDLTLKEFTNNISDSQIRVNNKNNDNNKNSGLEHT